MKLVLILSIFLVLTMNCKKQQCDFQEPFPLSPSDSLLRNFSTLLLNSGERNSPILQYLAYPDSNSKTNLQGLYNSLKLSESNRKEFLSIIKEPDFDLYRTSSEEVICYRLFITGGIVPQTKVYSIRNWEGVFLCNAKTIIWDAQTDTFNFSTNTIALNDELVTNLEQLLNESYFWDMHMKSIEPINLHPNLYIFECFNNTKNIKYNRVTFTEPLKGNIKHLFDLITSNIN